MVLVFVESPTHDDSYNDDASVGDWTLELDSQNNLNNHFFEFF